MTATFKVVEFYRNNTNINNNNNNTYFNNTNLINNSINIYTNADDEQEQTKATTEQDNNSINNILKNDSVLNLNNIPPALIASFNSIYDTLGFNLIGGYSTDIPATIIDVAPKKNGKVVKVEEGDILLEINGVSTRHLRLNEIYKQLRCCGNRVLLKLKSDPDFKESLKEILKEQKNIYPSLVVSSPISQEQTLNHTYIKNYDININSPYNQAYEGSAQNSPISSNISSLNNSHTNILEPTGSLNFNDISCESHLITESFNKLAVQSQAYNNDLKNKRLELDKKDSTLIRDKLIEEQNQLNSVNLSSPSSSSSLPTNSNDLYSGSSESSSSSASTTAGTKEAVIDQSIECSYSSPSSENTDNTSSLVSEAMTNGSNNHQPVLSFSSDIDDQIKKKIDEKLKECSDSDTESEYNVYTPKAVDLPSAQRLAKRLYYLDGFKANDIVRHLSKKNDFNQLVADEYLKLFNFQSLTLDSALRKFLKQFQLVGDAQEKERVLMYFAKRFVDANNTTFQDVDSCHTLTCAIMLLNTDLHDMKIQNKMTLTEFVENLKGLNNGTNFSDALLESLYSAIKNEPLECASLENEDGIYEGGGMVNGSHSFSLRPIGSNPFLQIPDPQTATEYKFGWLLRKCCIDSDGKRAPFLKRSWKMFYASLRDMVLYLHKDDKVFKNNSFDNISNAIRIHHAYASVAVDYKKKQFVFRLKTADWSEYLFQTSNSSELYDWVGTINSIASMFSSPPLPGGIGSSKTFQRPLMPVSRTRYTLQEQFEYHKKHIKQLQNELTKLESHNGASHLHIKDTEKFFDKDKYSYLQFEIQRYTVYANILEEKLVAEAAQAQLTNSIISIPKMGSPALVLNDQTNQLTTNNLNDHQFHQILPLTQNRIGFNNERPIINGQLINKNYT